MFVRAFKEQPKYITIKFDDTKRKRFINLDRLDLNKPIMITDKPY